MQKMLKNKYFAYFGAILCTALWGTAFPSIKLSYSYFEIADGDIASKLLLAGERFTLAGLMVIFAGVFICKKVVVPQKTDLLPILVLGIVQTTFQYVFSYIGVGFTTATNTSIISGTASLLSVIIASFVFKSDRLNGMKIAGCLVGLAGIISINLGNISISNVTLLGDFVVLLSALSGAGGNVISKVVAKNRNVVMVTGWQLLFGGVILFAIGGISGGRINHSNILGVVILLWLSFVSAVGFLLWTALLRYHPVSRITIFNMLVPVFGTFWSAVLLKEEIFKWQNVLALLLICAGIVFVNIKGNKSMKIKAVIFDMDGVVLDTEKLYVRFWCEGANFCGYPMTKEHALSIRSLARPFAIQKLQGYFGEDFDYDAVRNKRIELMEKYIEENGVDKKPNSQEILKWLKLKGYKVALATATPLERTERYLKKVDLYQYFDKIVCASMVKQGKPQPDIYLKACEELGFAPCECMAVEDSANGIISASSAGCVTVMAVDLDGPTEETAKRTYAVIENLIEIKTLLKDD